MQIRAVTLENVKSYDFARIGFTDGVNAIVGHNGAGKSTVLEAIGFALFDMLSYNAKEFVREGQKDALITVELISSRDDRLYHVIRRCGARNQHSVHDPELNSKLCEGKADVLAFLRQHMGVDVAGDLEGLFRDAVGVPQGTFTAAFLGTTSQRKSIFDPLLQVEEYRTASDRLNEPRKVLRERQTALSVQIAELEGRLKRLPVLEQEMERRQAEIVSGEGQLIEAKVRLKEVQERRSQLDEIQKQVVAAQQRHSQAAQRVHSLEEQIKLARKALMEAEAAQAIVQANQVGHDRYLAAQRHQKEMESQVQQRQQLFNQRSMVDKALALAESQVATLERERQEVAAAEATVAELSAAVTTQTQLEEHLAALQQQQARLTEAQSSLVRQQQEGQRIDQRIVTLRSQLSQSAMLQQEQANSESRLTTLQQEIDEQRTQLADYKAEADAIKRQNETLNQVETARCPVCEQPMSEAHRGHILQRNQERLDGLRTSYGRQQSSIKAAEGEISKLKAESQRLQNELLRLPRSDELSEAEKRLAAIQAEISSQQQRIVTMQGATNQIGEIEQQVKRLENPRQRSQIAAARASQRVSVESKLSKQRALIDEQQEKLAILVGQLAAFETLDADVSAVKSDLEAYVNAYQLVLANHKAYNSLADRQESVTNLQELLSSSRDELTVLENDYKIVAARFEPEEYKQAQLEEQGLRNQTTSLSTRLDLLRQEQQRCSSEVEQLHGQRNELQILAAQKDKIQEQEQTIETLRTLLKQAAPHITKAVIGQISSSASQVFGEIMQDYSHQLQWNEDYSITLEVAGRQRQFAQLSGGEQMSAALSVRLALLREMSNIDVAFFDEPTTNLDGTRRESLARQILEVKGFRQLFVISHDDTFEQATQNVIRLQRTEGGSSVQSQKQHEVEELYE